jgi:hypothetical protein
LPIEYGLISPVYNGIKDFYRWIRNKKVMTQEEIILARQEWKDKIEKHLGHIHGDQSVEVVVRDTRRIDTYPLIKEKDKGISSWFGVSIIETYHRGIKVFLKLEGLKYEETKEEWRYSDYKEHEKSDLNAHLIGLIPFERIVSIDWEGDEHYRCPHIYCHFISKSKEPYEELIFCEKTGEGQFVSYEEIAKYHNVRKLSKKLKKGCY